MVRRTLRNHERLIAVFSRKGDARRLTRGRSFDSRFLVDPIPHAGPPGLLGMTPTAIHRPRPDQLLHPCKSATLQCEFLASLPGNVSSEQEDSAKECSGCHSERSEESRVNRQCLRNSGFLRRSAKMAIPTEKRDRLFPPATKEAAGDAFGIPP